jgi:hypothetical protein
VGVCGAEPTGTGAPLSVGAAAAALVVGLTGSASAAAYDYEDPISSGCANTAITAQSTGIYVGSTRVGAIELRYRNSFAVHRPSGRW